MAKAYTEQEKVKFVALAEVVGVPRARKVYGFPLSDSTGHAWCKDRGVEPPKSIVSKYANRIKAQISAAEKRLVGAMLLDKIAEAMAGAKSTDLKNLAEAYGKVLASLKDVEDISTEQAEQSMYDMQNDKEYANAMAELEAKNKLYEQ